MKKDKQNYTFVVIDNYTQTDGHGDSMTNPAQRAEWVKTSTSKTNQLSEMIG